MKLIMENWRQYLTESEQTSPAKKGIVGECLMKLKHINTAIQVVEDLIPMTKEFAERHKNLPWIRGMTPRLSGAYEKQVDELLDFHLNLAMDWFKLSDATEGMGIYRLNSWSKLTGSRFEGGALFEQDFKNIVKELKKNVKLYVEASPTEGGLRGDDLFLNRLGRDSRGKYRLTYRDTHRDLERDQVLRKAGRLYGEGLLPGKIEALESIIKQLELMKEIYAGFLRNHNLFVEHINSTTSGTNAKLAPVGGKAEYGPYGKYRDVYLDVDKKPGFPFAVFTNFPNILLDYRDGIEKNKDKSLPASRSGLRKRLLDRAGPYVEGLQAVYLFPYDVDPSLSCFDKLRYLQLLNNSYIDDPTTYGDFEDLLEEDESKLRSTAEIKGTVYVRCAQGIISAASARDETDKEMKGLEDETDLEEQ